MTAACCSTCLCGSGTPARTPPWERRSSQAPRAPLSSLFYSFISLSAAELPVCALNQLLWAPGSRLGPKLCIQLCIRGAFWCSWLLLLLVWLHTKRLSSAPVRNQQANNTKQRFSAAELAGRARLQAHDDDVISRSQGGNLRVRLKRRRTFQFDGFLVTVLDDLNTLS